MMKKTIKKTKIYITFLRASRFFRSMDIKLRHMLFPCFLALLASLFEGIGFGLLIPTVKGILEGNFSFVMDIPFLNKIMEPGFMLLGKSQPVIFGQLLALIFISILLKNCLLYFSSIIIAYLGKKLANNLRKKIYARYLSFGKLFFDRTSAGHLYQVLLNFTEAVASQLGCLQGIIQMFLSFIVYLIIMAAISWQLTFFIFLMFPIFHFTVSWIIRKIRQNSFYLTESYSTLGTSISNALSSMPLIKAYQSEEREKKWFSHASGCVRDIQVSMAKKQALIPCFQEMISLTMLLTLVAIIAFLLVEKKIGDISGYMIFFLLIRRSTIYFGVFNAARVSLASIRGHTQEISKVFNDNDKFFIKCGTRKFTGLKENIKFDGVTFLYPEGIAALKDITLTIDKGKVTAIVGSSGSGKTTLISLIMRFYDILPEKIKIDGIDIKEFTLQSLMKKISLVTQETFIMNASLKTNITYGLEGDIKSEAISEAVKLAEMSDFVTHLPKGLDTNVGDRGAKLSGGEKQRVSIARAILKQAEIIILDEATSSLDSITESLIQKALKELVKNRTTIVIAHRLSTIKNADKIIVLENGRIAEQGSLNELLAIKGKFYEFWQEQKFF
ncbi:MAG: ABC transporter ATP-binding protein [Dehalococcoidia bacterium]|nr:MAG: ABC transporter ATP-binding protein [Dehalococcoidia bacterium]